MTPPIAASAATKITDDLVATTRRRRGVPGVARSSAP
jgi:hypothetical protein